MRNKNLKMDHQKWMKILTFVFTRAVVLYAAVFFLSTFVVDYKKIKLNTEVRDLNKIFPTSFKPLLALTEKKSLVSPRELMTYTFFYDRIVRYMPKQADGVGMLALCYYYSGDYKKSFNFFKKAATLEPKFFWYYYNAAIILAQEGRYVDALSLFERSLATTPDEVIKVINDSTVVYRSILQDSPALVATIPDRLKRAYLNTFQLMIVINYHLKHLDQVILVADKALLKNWGNQDVFNFYGGIAAFEMKNFALAESYFSKTIQLNPRCLQAYQYLAIVLRELGRTDVANTMLQKALEIEKTSDKVFTKENLLSDPQGYFSQTSPQIF